MVDVALKEMSPRLDGMYSQDGRKSIPPQRLLRALLVQLLYSVRSERTLMEQLQYNLLFRWFLGLSANEAVWHATVFRKNRSYLFQMQYSRACTLSVNRICPTYCRYSARKILRLPVTPCGFLLPSLWQP